ncbi:hypothetical protein OSB04_002110 [Centaurea solstitialis]|uniref:Uncharacterized protein n=1 Tax=Centaurea solstitialis TaxID=347529 RepID=A0AA38TSP1_9ASTR|nr:hypothetical protein OSB04_002110 [Centaurea solstitialis]
MENHCMKDKHMKNTMRTLLDKKMYNTKYITVGMIKVATIRRIFLGIKTSIEKSNKYFRISVFLKWHRNCMVIQKKTNCSIFNYQGRIHSNNIMCMLGDMVENVA